MAFVTSRTVSCNMRWFPPPLQYKSNFIFEYISNNTNDWLFLMINVPNWCQLLIFTSLATFKVGISYEKMHILCCD